MLFVVLSGCGTTTQRVGTEQLLISDAVDHAVAQLDFAPLTDSRVFLETGYLESVKGYGFVNAPYIISSLRQQLTAAGCLLQDNPEEADVIVEARVGALGTDGHEVIYGLPKNNLLSSAAAVIPNAPNIPTIPEISAARIDAQSGIAKLMVFAYDSQTRAPVWQSGVARAESTSRNSWVLGAGPFQKGSLHQGTRFAGEMIDSKLNVPFARDKSESDRTFSEKITYFEEHRFDPKSRPTPEKAQVAKRPDEEVTDDSDDSGKSGRP